jgi:hypothetical protein
MASTVDPSRAEVVCGEGTVGWAAREAMTFD